MHSANGIVKTLLLVAYAFGWSAVAKMISAYADSVGRETEVPPLLIAMLVQVFLCATGLLIYAWIGVDKSSTQSKEERYKFEKRQAVVLVLTLTSSAGMWIAYLY